MFNNSSDEIRPLHGNNNIPNYSHLGEQEEAERLLRDDEQRLIIPSHQAPFSLPRFLESNSLWENYLNSPSGQNLSSRLHYLFNGYAIPTNDATQLSRHAIITNQIKGAALFWKRIYPALFSVATFLDLKDAVYYRDPKLALQILSGTSPYAASMTSNVLGFGLEQLFIPGGLITLLGVSILAHDLTHSHIKNTFDMSQDSESLRILRAAAAPFHMQDLLLLFPWNQLSRVLNHAEFSLLWDKGLSENDRLTLVTEIKNLVTRGGLIKKYYGLSTMSNLLDKLYIKENANDPINNQQGVDVNVQIKKEALALLEQYQKAMVEYVDYIRWSLDIPQSHLLKPFFWFSSMYFLYTQFRFFEYYIRNSVIIIWDNIYTALECKYPQLGICSEADFIQHSLNWLFESLYSPAEIVQQAKILFANPAFKKIGTIKIDLSKQNLAIWNASDLTELFDNLVQYYRYPAWVSLDLSCTLPNATWKDDDFKKIQAVASACNQLPVTFLSLENQQIGAECMEQLAQKGFNNQSLSSIEALILRGNNVGNNGIKALAQAFSAINPLYLNFNLLDISNNNISHGIRYLTQLSQAPSFLAHLKIGENPFDQTDIPAIAQLIQYFKPEIIDFANTNLRGMNLTSIWSLPLLHKQSYYFKNTSLENSQMEALVNIAPNVTLGELDVSENNVANSTAEIISTIKALQGVNLNKDSVNGIELQKIAAASKKLKTLKIIEVSNGNFTKKDFGDFVPNLLIDSSGGAYNFANNKLGEVAAEFIIQIDNQSFNTDDSIVYINFSGNNISDDDAILIFDDIAISSSQPKYFILDLSDNQLTDNSMPALLGALPKLYSLNIAKNKIGPQGAQLIAAALPGSKLVSLKINDNLIGDEGALAIAQSLINNDLTLSYFVGKPVYDVQKYYLAHTTKATKLGQEFKPYHIFSHPLPDVGLDISNNKLSGEIKTFLYQFRPYFGMKNHQFKIYGSEKSKNIYENNNAHDRLSRWKKSADHRNDDHRELKLGSYAVPTATTTFASQSATFSVADGNDSATTNNNLAAALAMSMLVSLGIVGTFVLLYYLYRGSKFAANNMHRFFNQENREGMPVVTTGSDNRQKHEQVDNRRQEQVNILKA